jgi:Protein of unknown function (DUF1631)
MSIKHVKPGNLELIDQRGREPIQPPRLLAHIQKQCLAHCEQLLAHLFSATDDLFYDLSKRASSNNEQNLYFEAMREIRIRREGIAIGFLRTLNDLFTRLILTHEGGGFDSSSDKPEYSGNLSIVDGDDLEVDLARSNMVSRTRDIYREDLYELGMRLDHLLLQIEINENNNPLDPNQITKAFLDVCQDTLNVSIKAKLILYKLFEKHVLKQLGHIYADANQILLDAGILPKVPRNLDNKIVHGGGPLPERNPIQNPNGSQIVTPPNYLGGTPEFRLNVDNLGGLMSAARNFGELVRFSLDNPNYDATPNSNHQPYLATAYIGGPGGFTCYVYTTNPGPVMPAQELASLLTQSQPIFDQELASTEPRNIIADAVNQLLIQKDPEQPQALAPTEENVINLVGMFFDQILNDTTLPMEIQSLICRLQIPILKVALRDKSFFSDPKHPARLLINRITEIGIGFDQSKPIERDPVYRKMVEIVQTLNRQYKTDERIFSELQLQLEEMLEREKNKSTLVEQRTTQTETGKSRIKQARAAAQNAMYQGLKGQSLPAEIRTFLISHWLQVMVITYLKHGEDSSEWVSVNQAVTDLVWSCQEHDDNRSTQRRERLLPELLDRIEVALDVAIDNADLRATKVAALERILRAKPEEEPVIQETVAPLDEEQKEALGKGENAPKTWDEMTAVEKQQAKYEELSKNFFEMAKDMPVGTWLDYLEESSGKTLRSKLASKIDADTYIFVNRLGFKNLEKSRKQFAYDLQFNRAKVVDNRPFFDRIMNKVVTTLVDEDGANTASNLN